MPAEAVSLGAHAFGTIVGVLVDVVRLDGGDGDGAFAVFAEVVAGEAGELGFDVLDVGTMDAKEHEQKTAFGRGATEGSDVLAAEGVGIKAGGEDVVAAEDAAAEDIGEFKIRGWRAQVNHGRFGSAHSGRCPPVSMMAGAGERALG